MANLYAAKGTIGGTGQLTPDGRVSVRVPDSKGSYTIPYIQHSPEVVLSLGQPPPAGTVDAMLTGPDGISTRTTVRNDLPVTTLTAPKPGEYTLTLSHADGVESYTPIGVGTVIAALGDSITEGYHGHGFARDDLDLTAASFPQQAVSKDGRNFPQYAPTTSIHRPDVTTFQSWMTDLNDQLTETWKRPVFIANEGWGGITSEGYLALMQNESWRQRIRLLKPDVWIIHLGVNDERQGVLPNDLRTNLHILVDRLQQDFGAKPRRILLASPCYDYHPGAEAILRDYSSTINDMVTTLGLGSGPDFFAAYAQDRPRWYGDDPVHPNVEGMKRMAQLWHDALKEIAWT